MGETTEILKLLDVIEERNENFCSHDYKINLIYEHSELSIEEEIK